MQEAQAALDAAQEAKDKLVRDAKMQITIDGNAPHWVQRYEEANKKLWQAMEKVGATQEAIAALPIQINTDAAREAIKKLQQEAAAAKPTIQELFKAGQSLTLEVRTPQERLKQTLAEYKQLCENGAISAETFARATKKVNESTEEFKRGKALTEEMNPWLKLKTDLTGYVELLAAGTINDATFSKAVGKTKTDFEKAQLEMANIQKPVQVGAAVRGTTAGFAAVHEGKAELQKQLKVQEEQKKIQKQMKDLLSEIKNELKDKIKVSEVNI